MKIIILLFVISVSFSQKILSQGFEEELPGNSWTVSLTQFEDQTYFLKLENETLKNSYSNLYMLDKKGTITNAKKVERKKKPDEVYQTYNKNKMIFKKNFSNFNSKYATEYQIIDKENNMIYNLNGSKLMIIDKELNLDSLYIEFPLKFKKNRKLILENECYKGLDENKNPYWMFKQVEFYDEDWNHSNIYIVKYNVESNDFNYYYTTLSKDFIATPIGYLNGEFLFCKYKYYFDYSINKIEICSLDDQNTVKLEKSFDFELPKEYKWLSRSDFSLNFISPDHMKNSENLYFTIKIGYNFNYHDKENYKYQFIFYKFDGRKVKSVSYKNDTKHEINHNCFDVVENNTEEVRFMTHGDNGLAILWDVNFNKEEQTRKVFDNIAYINNCKKIKVNYRKDDSIYNLYLYEKLFFGNTFNFYRSSLEDNDNQIPLVFYNYNNELSIIQIINDCFEKKTRILFDPAVN